MFWNIVITFALGHSIERLNANTGDPGFAHDHNLALVLSSAFIIVVLAGLIYVVRSRREAISGFADGRRALLVTWLLVPALVVYLISVGKRDFTARHLISSAPAFYLLSAIGLYAFRKVNRALMVVAGLLLLVISIYSLGNYYSDVKYARDDMRSAAAFVQLHPMPQQAIIMDAGYFSQTFNYYYNVQTPWYGLPDGYPPDASATIARLDALGKQYDYLWLVLWQDYYSDPDRVVETFLDKNYVRTREEVFHGNIKVRGYSTLPLIAPNNLADAAPVNQQLGGKVELTGYTPAIMTGRGGQELDFTILWRALHSLSTNYTVFVHLNNSAGQLVAQADGPPAFGDLDSSNWPPGALIVDEHHLSVPLFTPPGDYQLDVGLYDRQTMRNLGAGGIDHVTLPVHLGPSEEGPRPNATSVDLGQSIQLAGYELKGNAKPGDTLGIDLLWKTKTPVVDDLTVFVHLVDSSGKPVAQSDAKPAADSYPTTMWQPGEIVRDGHQLKIPEDCPPGQYSIEVGLYDGLTGNRLAHSTFPWGRHETSILLRQLQINTR
jgi:hypothetical protein